MEIHFTKLLFHLLMWNLSNNALGISTSTDKDEDADVTITRECKLMSDCAFYTDLLKLKKAGLVNVQQEIINDELVKQNCGWENDMDPKGKKKILIYCNTTE